MTFSPKTVNYLDVLRQFGENLEGEVKDYELETSIQFIEGISYKFVNKNNPDDIVVIENVSYEEIDDLKVELEPVTGFFYGKVMHLQRKGMSYIKKFLTGKEYLEDPNVRLIATQEYLDILKK